MGKVDKDWISLAVDTTNNIKDALSIGITHNLKFDIQNGKDKRQLFIINENMITEYGMIIIIC